MMSTVANFPSVRNQGLIDLVGKSQTPEGVLASFVALNKGAVNDSC
jgi:hypothetical protein